MRLLPAILLAAISLCGQVQDFSADLLEAAMRGRTDQVKAFLDDGADLEAVDSSGRTALMLAAQHGHATTVELLLGRGARPAARDRDGATAFVLALFSPIGRGNHEAVLKLLPAPPRPLLALEATLSSERLVSSCFGSRADTLRVLQALQLPEHFLRAFGAYVQVSGRNLVELVGEPANADALLRIELQPIAACAAPAGDSLGLAIEIQLVRRASQEPLLKKSFGGGIKGLHAQTAANTGQYGAIFQPWIKPQAGPVYWAAAAGLYRAALAK